MNQVYNLRKTKTLPLQLFINANFIEHRGGLNMVANQFETGYSITQVSKRTRGSYL